MSGKEDVDVLMKKAAALQDEMHRMYDDLIKYHHPKKTISYDAFKDIYFLIKIADLEEDIYLLKLDNI